MALSWQWMKNRHHVKLDTVEWDIWVFPFDPSWDPSTLHRRNMLLTEEPLLIHTAMDTIRFFHLGASRLLRTVCRFIHSWYSPVFYTILQPILNCEKKDRWKGEEMNVKCYCLRKIQDTKTIHNAWATGILTGSLYSANFQWKF